MKHTRKARNKNPKPVKKEKPKLKLVPQLPQQQHAHPFERFMKINAPANVNTSYGNINRMNTRIPRRRAS